MSIDNEILQRVRRIETRLYKLCEHEGVAPPPGSQINAYRDAALQPCIDAQGYDVTLAMIVNALTVEGIDPYDKPVKIMVGSHTVGQILFAKRS